MKAPAEAQTGICNSLNSHSGSFGQCGSLTRFACATQYSPVARLPAQTRSPGDLPDLEALPVRRSCPGFQIARIQTRHWCRDSVCCFAPPHPVGHKIETRRTWHTLCREGRCELSRINNQDGAMQRLDSLFRRDLPVVLSGLR